jgi:hypothetical protein
VYIDIEEKKKHEAKINKYICRNMICVLVIVYTTSIDINQLNANIMKRHQFDNILIEIKVSFILHGNKKINVHERKKNERKVNENKK